MTETELKNFHGKNGQPAYVAVSGVIYDVSASPMWQDGNHVDQHQAGSDLTEALKSAPHVRSLIERFPVVGQLSKEELPKKRKSCTTFGIFAAIAIVLIIGWLFLF
ncbi:MAG: cytochrome B5 [Desulfuromonas sp.]|nr:MAG: cytochrome B5 [Desulfuromonas sp.]